MRWFVGSVATDLLTMAPCPILVCRTPHHNSDHSSDAKEAIGESSP
jgi:hypothetical protein